MTLDPYNILHTDPRDPDFHQQDVRTALRQRNLRQAAIELEREKLEAKKQNENKTTTGN